MKKIEVPSGEQPIEVIYGEADNPIALLILAHGAGAGMNHPFMENLANDLSENQFNILRFNFPYITAGRKFPASPKPNIRTWKTVTDWAVENHELPIFIGGKSYGGRMASHCLAQNDDLNVKGIIYFGFPLHAPGRDSVERADHLRQITLPQLFLQGTRDSLANFKLIQQVVKNLPHAVLKEIDGGDHSFKVKGLKHGEVIQHIVSITSKWIRNIS